MKKYQENPEYKGYLLENEGGQDADRRPNRTQFPIQKVGGRSDTTEFIGDNDEFAALDSLMKKDPKEAVAKLTEREKMAKKRYGPLPVITKDDLKEVMDDRVQTQLAESDKTRERTRYLFYEAFLNNPRSIRELKDNCQKWLAK